MTARLFRLDPTGTPRWVPVGAALGDYDHVPPVGGNYWVLPKSLGARHGDCLASGEAAWLLTNTPLAPSHGAWTTLRQATHDRYEPAEAEQWLADVEIWRGEHLAGGLPNPANRLAVIGQRAEWREAQARRRAGLARTHGGVDERAAAEALRRAGRSVRDIAEETGVPKSTVARWCRHVPSARR